jgi:lysophospholipase L1-like esterase
MGNQIISSLLVLSLICSCQKRITEDININNPPPGLEKINYLALGDSYTIGESVGLNNFPNQLADTLNAIGFELAQPEIIARTGWTTTDLLTRLKDNPPKRNQYDFVTLLIGVNNQYQGLDTNLYVQQFEELLIKSIALADNRPNRLWVLSIPDYAFTPFGMGKQAISDEIDLYNDINKRISNTYDIKYVYITDISRKGLDQPDLVAADGLHPSAKQYTRWIKEFQGEVEKGLLR